MCRKLFFLVSLVLLVASAPAALISQYKFEGSYAPTVGTVTGTAMAMGAFTNHGSWDVGKSEYGGHVLGRVANMSAGSGEGWIKLTNGDLTTLSNQVTVMGWIKYDSFHSSRVPISKKYEFQFSTGSGAGNEGKMFFQISDTTPISIVQKPTAVGDLQWHHYAGVFDSVGQSIKLYVDGILRASMSGVSGPLPIGTGVYQIGGRDNSSGGSTSGFEGWLDDVRVYDNALTEDQVRWAGGIPEPATIALLGLGGLLLRRKK